MGRDRVIQIGRDTGRNGESEMVGGVTWSCLSNCVITVRLPDLRVQADYHLERKKERKREREVAALITGHTELQGLMGPRKVMPCQTETARELGMQASLCHILLPNSPHPTAQSSQK